MQLTAEKAIGQIQKQAEKIKNDEPQRFPEAAATGDSWRQGDLYITRIESMPANYFPQKKPSLQLAPGNTQGSRHCLDSLDGVTLSLRLNPGMLDGPVIHLAKERTIEHPEHGSVILPPGLYQITYQRDLDAEDRERRVQD